MDNCKKESPKESKALLHPTTSLPLLVMLDMLAVSLVVPLLMQYYRNAGVTSAAQRELLSSIFSTSQIVGGILLGALADAAILKRKTILLISFGGSAVAYGLIVYGGIYSLIISRVLVGLVKQTMTVTTTLLASYTTPNNRAMYMGRLSASSTVAWVVGPAVGGYLYKNVHTTAPALLSVALFVVNILLAAVLLPSNEEHKVTEAKKAASDKFTSFYQNLLACFSSSQVGSVIVASLLFSWFTRATSYANMSSYYEEMYGFEPHQRGYLSSYQMLLSFLCQSFFIGPMLNYFGGERKAVVSSAFLMALVTLLEVNGNLYLFCGLLAPTISLSISMIRISLSSLVTHVSPKKSLGSVLAALDVLRNAVAVTVPFYRTLLFSLLTSTTSSGSTSLMQGDPDPRRWVLSAGAHWLVATVAIAVLLRENNVPALKSMDKKNQ